MLVAAHYPNPTAIGFSSFGERRLVAAGALPAVGEVVVEVPDHDQVNTLWRAAFVGRGPRVLSNPELTRRRDY